MACTSTTRRALVLLHLVCACSGGEDGSLEGGATILPGSSTGVMSTGTTAIPTTDIPTTGEPGTSTGDDPTTTGEPGTSSSSTDDSTGSICDPGQPNCVCDNGLCIDGYVCAGGVCMAGLVCEGDIEPPDESEDAPTFLADISDNDDEFHQVTGVLAGGLDVDWYRYHGADTFGHVSEPTLEFLSMGTGMRVCQFLECDAGGVAFTDVTCPEGTKFAISGKLRPGCCHTTGFTISDFNCDGEDESLQAYIRLDMPDQDICVDYEFKLHF